MEYRDFILKLSPEDLEWLTRQARALDVTPGHMVRDMVSKARRAAENSKTPNRADEKLVERFQRLLADDLAQADNWADLDRRLAVHDLCLKPAGGGLCLHNRRNGLRLCKSSELGFPYSGFVKRYKMPMPGHPHKMAHMLHRQQEDIQLIERF